MLFLDFRKPFFISIQLTPMVMSTPSHGTRKKTTNETESQAYRIVRNSILKCQSG